MIDVPTSAEISARDELVTALEESLRLLKAAPKIITDDQAKEIRDAVEDAAVHASRMRDAVEDRDRIFGDPPYDDEDEPPEQFRSEGPTSWPPRGGFMGAG